MKLYLIQHGLSLPEEEDPQKSLSEKGREETEKTARFLKAEKITVKNLWHSKKTRAVQTVQIISQYIECSAITAREDLNPNDPVDKFKEEIESSKEDIMIVGHLPFLRKLASLILSGRDDSDIISFKNSGVICLERQDKWKLAWDVAPELL